MKYLLDTNVISEIRKQRPHGAVKAWLYDAVSENLLLSAVSAGEIQTGIENCRLQDVVKAAELQTWLDSVVSTFTVLPMTAKEFKRYAVLMHRESETVRDDAMIAATALENNLTVVTRNVRDFQRFGVAVVNPFEHNNDT